MLKRATAPGWFAAASANLARLLSDHLHCERKAAENALSLVRRYASDPESVTTLGRLAHEETSHVVQVTELMARLGHRPLADRPNLYARALLAEVRSREPDRQLDLLLVAALIEARSHERLCLLAEGFSGQGREELARFYRALGSAEERHAEVYRVLASRVVPEAQVQKRLEALAARESEILAALPMESRIH
jgi:tRNA 2-(methylsulfanyl)-N6-isopentenyladenosine37 hydroxylase